MIGDIVPNAHLDKFMMNLVRDVRNPKFSSFQASSQSSVESVITDRSMAKIASHAQTLQEHKTETQDAHLILA